MSEKKKIFGDISESRGEFCTIEWEIEDYFSRTSNVDDEWESHRFSFCGATWYISVYPSGENRNNSVGSINLYLNKESPKASTHYAFFILGIKSNDGSIYKSRQFTYTFQTAGYGVYNLLTKDEFEKDAIKVATEGAVKFYCILHMPSRDKVDASLQTTTFDELSILSGNFKELFLSEEGSDVTLKVKDTEFHVHSQILTARSPVFAPMLTHDMKEKNTGVIEIVEYEPESFREFLFFLYTGKAEKISSENVIDLYCAAEKYDVKQLKTWCSDFMKENMSDDNFCDILTVAIRYSDRELLEFSKEFFLKHVRNIIVNVKWMAFAKEFPVQSNELFVKIVNQFVPR